MKSRSILFTLFVLGMFLFAACGAAAPAATQAPATQPPMIEMFAATQAPAMEAPMAADQSLSADKSGANQAVDAALPAPTNAAYEINNQNGENVVVQDANRKIIKNGDIKLLVKNTDVAIDRTTQIVGDAGGYIISSRVWYQDYFGNNLKYATVSIGVPVDQFESTLVRLRDLAIRSEEHT